MADFVNAVPHETYPALPEQAHSLQPDSGCSGCALANLDGHKTCSTFKLRNTPPISENALFDLDRIRAAEGALHRRSFDSDGIIGNFDSQTKDTWYFNNASRAINFAYASSWNVTGCVAGSGDDAGTCTVSLVSTDAKRVVYATWKEQVGFVFVSGFSSATTTQSLDMAEFQYPCKAHRLKSKILQITAATDTTLSVKIDKDLSQIYDSYFPVDDGMGGTLPDPSFPTMKIYHYGKEAERWSTVENPHYFLGRLVTKTIEPGDLPSDKIWELELDVVHPPDSLDPLVPNFVLEGFESGTGWVTIAPEARLHIKHGYSAVSLGSTLPAGSIQTSVSDITGDYENFRATYYVETTDSDLGCKIVGYDRCFYSRTDKSKSYGNYNAGYGVSVNSDGEHVYCSQRVYQTHTIVGGSAVNTDNIPSGLANFPASGKCIQYNFCEQYTNSLNKMGEPEAPFNMDYLGLITDLVFETDKYRRQRYTLATGSGGYVVGRQGLPSVMYLLGFYRDLVTPGGFHPTTEWRGHGSWSVSEPATVTDASGNESLVNATGLERGFLSTWNGSAWVVDPNREGNIPSTVSGFKTKRDPFSRSLTVSDSLLEYIGCTVHRDSGEIDARRGLGRISMAVDPEDIIAPNFDLLSEDLQTHTRATYQRDSVSGDGLLTILPYRQETKADETIGDRVIHLVTPLGDGEYEIEFTNTEKSFSRFDLGDLGTTGDSYDRVYTVEAGGGPCILPYEPQGLFSYEGDNSTGSRNAGAAPMDCIEVNGQRFVIKSVTPHGGSEPLYWGDRQVVNKGAVGGFFEAAVTDDLTPISIVSVVRDSDTTTMTVLSDVEKPVLGTDEVWFDGNNRIYFSSADDSESFTIDFENSESVADEQYFTVNAEFSVSSSETEATDYSEWTSAVTKSISIDGVAATIIDGGATVPAAGECRVNDNSGKIQWTFNVDDAGKDWRMTLTYAANADEPDDDWCAAGNYTSFGKKRDKCVVIADRYNSTDYFDSNDVVGDTATFIKSGTVFLPALNQVVQATPYQSDSWVSFTSSDIVEINAASGRVRIASSAIASIGGFACFKLPGVQMVDNRGQCPATLLNKIEDVVDQMQWVRCTPGGSEGGDLSWGVRNEGEASWSSSDPEDPCSLTYFPPNTDSESSSSGNHFYFGYTGAAGGFDISYNIAVSSSGWSVPREINNFPDGMVFLDAFMEIESGGMTRTETQGTSSYTLCDDTVIPATGGVPDTTLSNIDYHLIGFSTADDYEIIGTISGATANKTQVLSGAGITAMFQKMYDERKSGKYAYGLALLPAPAGVSVDGDYKSLFDIEPSSIQKDYCEGHSCFPGSFTYYIGHYNLEIDWTSASIGNVWLKVDYNGKDKVAAPQSRAPSMETIP